MSESEIKIYRITGRYQKNRKEYLFRKEKRALKREDAVEKVLSQITSIGLLRRQITIDNVEEITPEQAEDYLIKELSEK
ncbi:MAG: 50S ribosomal protein L18Ae [Promethearchaeota archaeon]|nr:MAG: 50S ribosomal protein L18Ae [Candidatus Lokiarchaeota archaeon]